MSWQENRRRKRTWYKHYRRICDRMLELMSGPEPMAAEALVIEFFKTYEMYRMHGKRRIANSAWESIELAVKDTGLDAVSLRPTIHVPSCRPPCKGQIHVTVSTPTVATVVNAAPASGIQTLDDLFKAINTLKSKHESIEAEVPF